MTFKPVHYIKPLWQCRFCEKIFDEPAEALEHATSCKKQKGY